MWGIGRVRGSPTGVSLTPPLATASPRRKRVGSWAPPGLDPPLRDRAGPVTGDGLTPAALPTVPAPLRLRYPPVTEAAPHAGRATSVAQLPLRRVPSLFAAVTHSPAGQTKSKQQGNRPSMNETGDELRKRSERSPRGETALTNRGRGTPARRFERPASTPIVRHRSRE
jgi:hypothetical protein